MKFSTEELLQGILAQDKRILGKAITLIESKKPEHRVLAEELLKKILPYAGKSVRIGITGVPGAGKSTFIESFGKFAISQGKKVAVLAIDPSSSVNKGSILGDKTRMEELAKDENAFIRPSPSSGFLGGVANTTFETMLICEAAGYDYILIETVGVGQSEVLVADISDVILLLKVVGTGDELQGIILTKQDAVFRSRSKHTVRLIHTFGHEVVNQYTDVSFVASQHEWLAAVAVQVRVDTCNDTLSAGFFVSGCPVYLSGEEQVFHHLRFQCMLQLCRVEVVVFDSISRTVHHQVFEARNLFQCLQLDFHRE
jgi:Ni2+-binding GTPase involved in maturation of urease and hydrogenase